MNVKQELITICARRDSKGLPGKNMKLFQGKPLIYWTIEQSLEYGEARVCVSTDCDTIIEYVKDTYRNKVLTVKRPYNLALDDTPKLDAIRHAHRIAEET